MFQGSRRLTFIVCLIAVFATSDVAASGGRGGKGGKGGCNDRDGRGKWSPCGDGSHPLCQDGSKPDLSGGFPPSCIDGSSPLCSDGRSPQDDGRGVMGSDDRTHEGSVRSPPDSRESDDRDGRQGGGRPGDDRRGRNGDDDDDDDDDDCRGGGGKGKFKKNRALIIGAAVGCGLLIMSLCCGAYCWRRAVILARAKEQPQTNETIVGKAVEGCVALPENPNMNGSVVVGQVVPKDVESDPSKVTANTAWGNSASENNVKETL